MILLMQTIGFTMDLLKALCVLLRCWYLCWLHFETTCSSLGIKTSKED